MEQLIPTESKSYEVNMPVQNTNSIDITELAFPESEKKVETKTKEYVVEEMKEQPGKVKIDFFGGDNPNSFINQKTEPARPDISTPGNYINSPLNSPSNSLGSTVKTKEEIRGNVSTIIAIVDYLASLLGMIISGDKNQSKFTADSQQKKVLETALVDYMYEKQTKLSSGVALFLAFLGAYGFMLLGACRTWYENYKAKKDAKIINNDNLKHPIYNKEDKQKVEKEKIYVEKKDGSGDLIYRSIPKPMEFPPVPKELIKSSPINPDPNVTANNKQHLLELISNGIYPMYKKNDTNNKIIKVNYGEDGKPKLQGKPPRTYSHLKKKNFK